MEPDGLPSGIGSRGEWSRIDPSLGGGTPTKVLDAQGIDGSAAEHVEGAETGTSVDAIRGGMT